MGWVVALPLLWSCASPPECRRFRRVEAAARGAGRGELTVMRALAVGRWDASVCMSGLRFAPVDCGAVAAVAVEPSADAAADEAVAAAARLRASWRVDCLWGLFGGVCSALLVRFRHRAAVIIAHLPLDNVPGTSNIPIKGLLATS